MKSRKAGFLKLLGRTFVQGLGPGEQDPVVQESAHEILGIEVAPDDAGVVSAVPVAGAISVELRGQIDAPARIILDSVDQTSPPFGSPAITPIDLTARAS